MKTIACPPDCRYLEREEYQSQRRHDRAASRGKKFIQDMSARFREGDFMQFAIQLQADFYLHAREHGALDDRGAIKALEDLRGLLSKIYIPAGEPFPVTLFLYRRIDNSPRYSTNPAFSRKDQLRVIEDLIRYVRSLGSGEERRYQETLELFYDLVDFHRDFNYDETDYAMLRGGAGGEDEEGLRRSAGGVILPP